MTNQSPEASVYAQLKAGRLGGTDFDRFRKVAPSVTSEFLGHDEKKVEDGTVRLNVVLELAAGYELTGELAALARGTETLAAVPITASQLLSLLSDPGVKKIS